MPVTSSGEWRIDFSDDGAGEAVVLLHSSVSGNRQWRALVDDLKDRYRLLAINLFGYGETTPWPGDRVQSLADQTGLVDALCRDIPGPIHLVGHSFGGTVALKSALSLGARLGSLILLEPNPFFLLAQEGRLEAYDEITALKDHVKRHGDAGDWDAVAERFADYWIGDGAWAAMPESGARHLRSPCRPTITNGTRS